MCRFASLSSRVCPSLYSEMPAYFNLLKIESITNLCSKISFSSPSKVFPRCASFPADGPLGAVPATASVSSEVPDTRISVSGVEPMKISLPGVARQNV